MDLRYPTHFLHDIDGMSAEDRDSRSTELIAWAKRLADGNANPKWVRNHMYELARLLEITRADAERLRTQAGQSKRGWVEAAEVAIQRGDFGPLQLRIDAARVLFSATETQ